MNIELRNYQFDGFDAIKTAIRDGFRHICYQLCTGGGKTILFCYIADKMCKNKQITWILVHRDNLLRQASDKLDKLDVPHGLIASGYPLSRELVQVCSVDTLINRLEKIPKHLWPDLIITDECHHVAGHNKWMRIIQFFKCRSIGFSATPWRLDGKGLGAKSDGVYEIMIQGPDMPWMISNKFLCPMRYFRPETVDMSSVHIRGSEYDQKEVNQVVDKPKVHGNAVSHYKKIINGMRTIAFCHSINSAKNLCAEFKLNGIPAAVITGEMGKGQQDACIRALAARRILVLCSVDVVSEGTDIPELEAAIMLRPTMSLSLFLQMAGRVMRLLEGKKFGYLLDMVGNIKKHGLPEKYREWSLDGITRQEKSARKKNDDGSNLKDCGNSKCGITFEGMECPACGWVSEGRKLEEVAGELVELSGEEYNAMMQKKEKKKEEGRAGTLVDWYLLAHERGYKWGWAEHRYKARTGMKPISSERTAAMLETQRIIDERKAL